MVSCPLTDDRTLFVYKYDTAFRLVLTSPHDTRSSPKRGVATPGQIDGLTASLRHCQYRVPSHRPCVSARPGQRSPPHDAEYLSVPLSDSFKARCRYPPYSMISPSTIPDLPATVWVRIVGESLWFLIRTVVSNIKEQASFTVNRTKHGIDQGVLRPIDHPAAFH